MTAAAGPRRTRASGKGGKAAVPRYDPRAVESAARRRWEEAGCFRAKARPGRGRFFCATMHATLSGPLHVGHCRSHVVGDVMARMQRMRGRDVLQSVGWEGLGLRVRMAAEDAGTEPAKWVERAKEGAREVMRRLGLSVDLSREVCTSGARHRELAQRLFARLWKAEPSFLKEGRQPGVAYWDAGTRSYVSPRQLVNGRGPESGMLAEIREVETYELDVPAAAAESLLAGLERLPRWDSFVRNMQRESIGLEEGLAVVFEIRGGGKGMPARLEVFTSRPDTVMGATYLAVGAGHELARRASAADPAVRAFCETVTNPRYAIRKLGEDKRQEGMPLGVHAINPINGDHIPVWVTNYVVAGYGTGATLGVPAHDQRDFNFALRHSLPMRQVAADGPDGLARPLSAPYLGRDGVSVNSAGLERGLNALRESLAGEGGAGDAPARRRRADRAVRELALEFLGGRGAKARKVTVARLRGWKLSQDEFWGCPVPLVHCPSCGTVPVPERDMPVELPRHVPGRESLADYPAFVRCECPSCGGKASRDTDTLSEMFGTSWSFALHGTDGDPFKGKAGWLPVDHYCCGVEHATTQLLCARIMHRCMSSLGLAPGKAGPEPFRSLMCQGPVLNYGLPMAPWYGNTVDPLSIMDECGADVLRLLLATNVDPRHPLHWDDEKLFALQGVLAHSELEAFRKGSLKGIRADLAERTLTDRERRRLRSGLLDRGEMARLRAGALKGAKLRKVLRVLGPGDVERLQRGVLDEAGYRALRKGALGPDGMERVRKVLDEREVARLQRGLLDRQQLRLLVAGKLPDKLKKQAAAIVGEKALGRLADEAGDIDEPGEVERIQAGILDPIEDAARKREADGLDLLRKARGILTDGELNRLRSGLLDDRGYAALRRGTLKGKRLADAKAILGKEGLARLRHGLLDVAGMERLYTGELRPKERRAVERTVGKEAMAALDKAALPRKKFEKLKLTLGGSETFERLRNRTLGPERTRQAEAIVGKRKLAQLQAAPLGVEAYGKLAGFVGPETMDRLVSFVDHRTESRLRGTLSLGERERLCEPGLGRPARPLLRFLDVRRMDRLLCFLEDGKMDALVNHLDPERMESLLGFVGNFWHVVASKADLVAASSGRPAKGDRRRAALHRCLKAIDASYLKDGTAERSRHGNRDLELSKVLARAREMLLLLDGAVSVDSQRDCDFAAECARVLLSVMHPIIPHATEGLWAALGFGGLLCEAPWPKVDSRAIRALGDETYVVQVGGRKRLAFTSGSALSDREAEDRAREELGRQAHARGYPSFPPTGERVVAVEWARRDAEHVVNFVTGRVR